VAIAASRFPIGSLLAEFGDLRSKSVSRIGKLLRLRRKLHSLRRTDGKSLLSAWRRIFLMRLNAAETAAKSSDRARRQRLGPRKRIAHIVGSGKQHGIHHVVSKPRTSLR